MVKTEKRCGEIDLFRFIFSAIITMRHADVLLGESVYFPGGVFGVEFFLVSGYLMMLSIDRMKAEASSSLGSETLTFMKKKISVLYPEVILSLVLAFIVRSVALKLDATSATKLASGGLLEALLLTHTGFGKASLIGPIWYLSTMLVAMMILYPLIRRNKDTTVKIVLPLISVLVLGYLL